MLAGSYFEFTFRVNFRTFIARTANLLRWSLAKLTVEQIRAVVNSYLDNHHLPTAQREQRLTVELYRQRYYQQTRILRYDELGIDVENIKSCIIDDQTS